MSHLNDFIKMLDSQRIRYKRYDHANTIEIAIPAFDGYSCYEFDFKGQFECLWDRSFEYPDDLND